MEEIKINDRLMSAVAYVRKGSRFADIGTDHAYLPIFLIENGVVDYAIAADINRGPLDKANENILKCGQQDKIKTVLCDGLSKIYPDEVDDIAIFGMGGELIVKIIDEAPWTRSNAKRLILQPMTHPEKLREYLAKSGFNIIGEDISLDRGKIYQTICAEYDGICRQYDDITLNFGEYLLKNRSHLLLEMMKNTKKQLERKILGKKSGGEDITYENNLLSAMNAYIERE